MIELKGKYNNCKVFTDNIDSETISQLTNLLNQEFVSGGQIRIMPDTHAGKGCVIGTTMTITDKVVPNLVGVDIGCFQGDTKVWTSFGWIKIKELINKGVFTVDSYDTETKQFVMGKAVAKKTRENAELVKVVYNTVSIFNKQRYEVLCTPDHKFLVKVSDDNEQWIEAKNLERDMKLVSEDHKIIVESVENTDRREDVYCLTVEDTHTFLIEGSVVVHNCGMRAVKLADKHLDLPNLDNVIRKYVPYVNAELLLSTIAPKEEESIKHMIKLSKDISKVGLQFSIHKSTDEIRNKLIPYENKLTLEEIRDLAIVWWKETGRHPYLNYCIDGTNNTNEDIKNLQKLFSPIVFNFTFSVVCSPDENMKEAGFKNIEQIRKFEQAFIEKGYNTRVFDPAGQDDIGGGCGQLWFVQKWLKEHIN